MPRSLEPGNRIVFVLDCDKDKEPQPRAFGKTLSISGSRKLIGAMEGLRTAATIGAKLDMAIDAAMSVLTGWENMIDPISQQPIQFNRESLADVYSIEELTEILSIAAGDGRLSVDERKKSESQHSLAAESSAEVVPVTVPGS